MTKPAKRKNVYMDEETSRALKRLGGGNVSKGIREAVRLAEAVKRDNLSQCASEGETPEQRLAQAGNDSGDDGWNKR